MTDITKPNDLINRVWASSGDIDIPSTGVVGTGWSDGEEPTAGVFNYLQNRTDLILEYLYQKGILEWDINTPYIGNKSFVAKGGSVFKAKVDNTSVDPNTDTLEATWLKVLDSSGAIPRSSEATLKNRANHTGTQSQSTITNLTTDLATKEVTTNKATDFTSPDHTKYPSVQAVIDYVSGAGGNTYLKTETSTNVVTSNTTLVKFKTYDVDSSAGTFTLTLPPSPSIGDWIGLCDLKSAWETNKVTLARNGNNIEFTANDWDLDKKGWCGYVEYRGATSGWVFRG